MPKYDHICCDKKISVKGDALDVYPRTPIFLNSTTDVILYQNMIWYIKGNEMR